MQAQKQKELINEMNDLDVKGVRFHDAKKQLLNNGYTEDEISIAVASASFDGKLNEPKKPHGSRQLFKDNPKETEAIAKHLLLDDAQKQQRKVHLQALSAAAWGARMNPMATRSFVTLSDTLGVPLFRLMFIGLFMTAILYGIMMITHWIDLDGILVFMSIYAAAVSLFIGYKLLVTAIQTARLHASANRRATRTVLLRGVGPAVAVAIAVALVYYFL